MGEQIAVLSSGVWQIRELVKQMTGFEPVRWLPPLKQPEFGCVVGWGLKSTSSRAQKLAKKSDKTYIAMEDGFIRSVVPGPKEIPVSVVVDHSGVYYDATDASDLEKLVIKRAASKDLAMDRRALSGMELLRKNRISKYNHAPFMSTTELGLSPEPSGGRVLVVDQTYGDSSISYGMADTASFERMLDAAKRENPDAEIIVKIHPDVICGRKKGYLSKLKDDRVKIISEDVNPWSLIEAVDKVYVVTSQLGFEALLAGREVICFGAPFYSSWGLTDDRSPIARRSGNTPTIEQLFAAVYFDYARYVNPETKSEIFFEDAAAWLINQRDQYFKKLALD